LLWPSCRLDDDEWYSFVGHLDGVGVAKLVRREASSDARVPATRRSSARAAAGDHGRPRVGPLMTQNSGPTGSSTRRSIHRCRFPGPLVHADLGAPAALAAAHEQRATTVVEI